MDVVVGITTKFACSEDDIMLAMHERDSDLWHYIDRYMTWANIEDFVAGRNDPSVVMSLEDWRQKYHRGCSYAVFRTAASWNYRMLGYELYFPTEKHKAKFLLAYGPFTKKEKT